MSHFILILISILSVTFISCTSNKYPYKGHNYDKNISQNTQNTESTEFIKSTKSIESTKQITASIINSSTEQSQSIYPHLQEHVETHQLFNNFYIKSNINMNEWIQYIKANKSDSKNILNWLANNKKASEVLFFKDNKQRNKIFKTLINNLDLVNTKECLFVDNKPSAKHIVINKNKNAVTGAGSMTHSHANKNDHSHNDGVLTHIYSATSTHAYSILSKSYNSVDNISIKLSDSKIDVNVSGASGVSGVSHPHESGSTHSHSYSEDSTSTDSNSIDSENPISNIALYKKFLCSIKNDKNIFNLSINTNNKYLFEIATSTLEDICSDLVDVNFNRQCVNFIKCWSLEVSGGHYPETFYPYYYENVNECKTEFRAKFTRTIFIPQQ